MDRLSDWQETAPSVEASFHLGPQNTFPGKQSLLSQEQLRQLSELRPLNSHLRIAAEWLVVFAVAAITLRYFNIWIYLCAVVVIGARQHALLMLLHEGSHRRLHPNQSVNRWVSEVFLAFPFFITLYGFSREHLAHHRLVGTENDPEFLMKEPLTDYQFPKTRTGLLGCVLKCFIGLSTFREYTLIMAIGQYTLNVPRNVNIARAIFYAVLATLVINTGNSLNYLLFWLIPMATYLVFVLYYRLVAEHFGLPAEAGENATRTVLPTAIERFLLAPIGINYHTEHHLFPSVPYYRMRKLHRLLMQSKEFASQVHLTKGYFSGLMHELISGKRSHSYSSANSSEMRLK